METALQAGCFPRRAAQQAEGLRTFVAVSPVPLVAYRPSAQRLPLPVTRSLTFLPSVIHPFIMKQFKTSAGCILYRGRGLGRHRPLQVRSPGRLHHGHPVCDSLWLP